MNFGNIVIMMSRFGSKSGDFAQRGANNKSAHIKFQQKLSPGIYYLNILDKNNEIKNIQTIIIK